MLEQDLPNPLGSAPVQLALDDERIDDASKLGRGTFPV